MAAPSAIAPSSLPPALIEDAPRALLERVTETRPLGNGGIKNSAPRGGSFVLYLPTVLLRKEHNPAFALAARLANAFDLPLLVLATALDDSSTPERSRPTRAASMTSRRLCFALQALSSAAKEWKSHGAAVAIRVQGRGARTPDYLSLCAGGGVGAAAAASVVVTDEPFVHPYLGYCRRIEEACASSGVRCYRVDGSSTVPPAALLRRRRGDVDARGGGGGASSSSSSPSSSSSGYDGVPAKAWMWQKKTEGRRGECLRAAMAGDLDAPELRVRVDEDRSFLPSPSLAAEDDDDAPERVIPPTSLPRSWRDPSNPAPGLRPWSAAEIPPPAEIPRWSVDWEGADPSVPPCPQTQGTAAAGYERWRAFLTGGGLGGYARSRNDVRRPHAVSRMSCYLNLGVVSIFRVASDLYAAKRGGNPGAAKFEEELIKWREIGYAHCFANPDTYAGSESVPDWARRYLDGYSGGSGGGGAIVQERYPLADLERGATGNANWDAMQRYLVSTGELHNNARMPWGKTVVHWLKRDRSHASRGESPDAVTRAILRDLILLNDRYALDGLSPPSYAGILWCFGWGDKAGAGPGGSRTIKEKPASRHRAGPDGFAEAEEKLLRSPLRPGGCAGGRQPSILSMIARTSSSTSLSSTTTLASAGSVKEGPSTVVCKKSRRIDSFFTPTSRPKKRASMSENNE